MSLRGNQENTKRQGFRGGGEGGGFDGFRRKLEGYQKRRQGRNERERQRELKIKPAMRDIPNLFAMV